MKDTHRANSTSDEQIKHTELLVSLVLQIGVTVSAVIILLGLVLFFSQHMRNNNPLTASSYQQYVSPAFAFPHNLSALAKAIKNGNGISIIMLGLLLLIVTPVLRVATSILLFLRQQDIPMTLVTFFVLIILLGSFFVGVIVR